MTVSLHKRVLILVHERPKNPKNLNWYPFINTIKNALATDDISVDIESLKDLVYVNDGHKLRVYNPITGVDLAKYNFVIFRTVRNERTRAACCAQLLQIQKIPYIDSMYRPGAYSKVSSDFMRTAHGIPVISSIFASATYLCEFFETHKPFDYPFILKDIQGRKGNNNYLVHDNTQLQTILNNNPELEFIAQEYIPNDGDYRCLVMGGAIKLVMHRFVGGDTHLNNTSQGGISKLVDISEIDAKAQQDVLEAARIDKIDLAGVDLIYDKRNNKHYIMEVNSSPQLTTGGFPEKKVAAFVEYLKELLL